jgi:protein-S-isoprenylcysteine O-methyltransferase Ste14
MNAGVPMKVASWRLVVTAVLGSAIFLGVPLVSWGVGDIGRFFAHPARVGYCVAVVLVQVAALGMLPDGGRGRREGKKTVARQRVAVVLLQILSVAAVVVAPWGDGRGIGVLPAGDTGRYAGLVLFGVGYAVVIWATAVLGKQFSVQVTIQEGHRLVTEGPYRRVRHPRYAGIVMFLAGYALIFSSWPALVLAAGVGAVLAWRVHDEEVLLRAEFGGEWEAYVKRSKRIVPWVY